MTGDAVVKIDKQLLRRMQELIKKNRFLYSSNKQVVNLAIIEFLNVRNYQKTEISEQSKKPLLAEGFLNAQDLVKNKRKEGKKRQDG